MRMLYVQCNLYVQRATPDDVRGRRVTGGRHGGERVGAGAACGVGLCARSAWGLEAGLRRAGFAVARGSRFARRAGGFAVCTWRAGLRGSRQAFRWFCDGSWNR